MRALRGREGGKEEVDDRGREGLTDGRDGPRGSFAEEARAGERAAVDRRAPRSSSFVLDAVRATVRVRPPVRLYAPTRVLTVGACMILPSPHRDTLPPPRISGEST